VFVNDHGKPVTVIFPVQPAQSFETGDFRAKCRSEAYDGGRRSCETAFGALR